MKNASNLSATSAKLTAATKQQAGSVLVPLLIVAIIIVLILMWQAGIFGGADSASTNPTSMPTAGEDASVPGNNPDLKMSPAESPTKADISFAADPEQTKAYADKKLATENAAIDTAAQQLLANNTPNFTTCNNNDAEQALDCAAKEQTRVLQAVFADHNALRKAGDEITVERGGAVMQRVIDALQTGLEPFVKAADNP